MDINEFSQQVEAWQKRIPTLWQSMDGLSRSPRLTETFCELHIASEELQVAEEELHQQNEKLQQQNQELAVAQLVVESQCQRYQELFEFAPECYIVTDMAGTIRAANCTAAKLFNVPQQFLVNKPLNIFFTKEVRRSFLSKLNQLSQVNSVSEWEAGIIPRNCQPINVALKVFTSASIGQPITLCWLIRDITATKQAEAQTHRLQTELSQRVTLAALLNCITDKVRDSLDESQILQTVVQELAVGLNLTGCQAAWYEFANGAATASYDYVTSTPTSQETLQVADFPEIYQQLLQRQYCQFCSIVPHPVGDCVAMLVCPIFCNQGVLGELWLINHKHHAFNELEIQLVQQVASHCATAVRQTRFYRATTAQVEELQKLNQLKDDLLSNVSHELRTPISNMKVAIQLLQSTPTAERQKRYLQILQTECDREVELINILLDLQQLEAASYFISLETVNLQEWLPSIIEPFQLRTQERQQRLCVELPSQQLPPILSDRASLSRLLAELLNNAYKYTPNGGEIVLRVDQKSLSSAGNCNPLATTPREATLVTTFIVSNSAEIPAANLPYIFDKFYRVPDADPWKQAGTGLGLALVQKLVEQLQGNIFVESFNGWTTFSIELSNQPKS